MMGRVNRGNLGNLGNFKVTSLEENIAKKCKYSEGILYCVCSVKSIPSKDNPFIRSQTNLHALNLYLHNTWPIGSTARVAHMELWIFA